MNTCHAETGEQWRKWLEDNHRTAHEIWLIFWKKHTGKPCIDYDTSVETAVCFGWIDSLMKSVDEQCYARKFSPRAGKSDWSFLNRERALEMMRQGKMTEAGMEAVKEAMENGSWYLTPQTVEMPVELENKLDTNREAALYFAELAPSYRKQFMSWVGEAKKPEIRLKRAEDAVQLLAKHMKLPMK
jgi:uncharacterized protein YdeI (YjbR/CyaY-like superfamily)